MKNKIITLLMIFAVSVVVGSNFANDNVMAASSSAKTVTKTEKSTETLLNPQLTQKAVTVAEVKPLDLIENPDAYLNKKIKIKATFDKFSILGLDYKPALRSSEKYITFLIQRPEVSNDIPLSELKNFLSRELAEKFIDLNNGDVIEYTGTVFSSALGDAWVDVDSITVIKKKEDKKTK